MGYIIKRCPILYFGSKIWKNIWRCKKFSQISLQNLTVPVSKKFCCKCPSRKLLNKIFGIKMLLKFWSSKYEKYSDRRYHQNLMVWNKLRCFCGKAHGKLLNKKFGIKLLLKFWSSKNLTSLDGWSNPIEWALWRSQARKTRFLRFHSYFHFMSKNLIFGHFFVQKWDFSKWYGNKNECERNGF